MMIQARFRPEVEGGKLSTQDIYTGLALASTFKGGTPTSLYLLEASLRIAFGVYCRFAKSLVCPYVTSIQFVHHTQQ